MNPDDAFERILASLYEAALDDARRAVASALIDEACGVGGRIASLIETAKLNGVNPHDWLRATLEAIAAGQAARSTVS